MSSLMINESLKNCLSEATLMSLVDMKSYNLGIVSSKINMISDLLENRDYNTLFAMHYELDTTLKIHEREFNSKCSVLKHMEYKVKCSMVNKLAEYFPDAKGYPKEMLSLIDDIKELTTTAISEAFCREIEDDNKIINSFIILKSVVSDVLDLVSLDNPYSI
jgi:hypothetical protein